MIGRTPENTVESKNVDQTVNVEHKSEKCADEKHKTRRATRGRPPKANIITSGSKKITKCPHVNRRYYCRGMCCVCYNTIRKTKLAKKC